MNYNKECSGQTMTGHSPTECQSQHESAEIPGELLPGSFGLWELFTLDLKKTFYLTKPVVEHRKKGGRRKK